MTKPDRGWLVLCTALKYWANEVPVGASTTDSIATITWQAKNATKPISSLYTAEVLSHIGATESSRVSIIM